VFARDSQIYLLALGSEALSTEIHSRMSDAFAVYLSGINQALLPNRDFIIGDHLTLADICFVAELALFHNEKPRARDLEKRGLKPILDASVDTQFPRAITHFARTLQTSSVRSGRGSIPGEARESDTHSQVGFTQASKAFDIPRVDSANSPVHP